MASTFEIPAHVSTTREPSQLSNRPQLHDRTLSIFCPPLPTPLAESAFKWGFDGDGRLVQTQTWPDTPVPWQFPTEVRPSTGRAEPLLPPADADDEVSMLPPIGVPALNGHETLSDISKNHLRPRTTSEKLTPQGGGTIERPPSRGLRLTRSLTNAFRKRPTALHSPSPGVMPASIPSTPITSMCHPPPSTPDPRKLKFSADSLHVPYRVIAQTVGSTAPYDIKEKPQECPGSSSDSKLTSQACTITPEEPTQKPSTPRRIIHFLWNGRRWSHEIERPENYIDQLSTKR